MIKQHLWMQLTPELKTKSSLQLLVNIIPLGEKHFHPPVWQSSFCEVSITNTELAWASSAQFFSCRVSHF